MKKRIISVLEKTWKTKKVKWSVFCSFMAVSVAMIWLFTAMVNADPPVITSFTGNGEMTWTSSPGISYRVEWSPDLVAGTWYRDWWDLRYIIASETETKANVPMFYRVVEDTSTYGKNVLSSVWFIRSPEILLYIIGDGAGTIDEISSFNPGTPPGLYDIFPDGAFCAIIQEANDPDVGLIGQFLSQTYGVINRPFKTELIKVDDLSRCQGSWSGDLSETTPGSTVTSVTFDVNASGEVTSFTGLAATVTGKMFALSDGTLVSFWRTGESGSYNQIWLSGLLSGDTATGAFQLDIGGDDPNGTFSFTR